MANARNVKPKNTVLTLGGKDRELRYDLNALAELEEAYGTIEDAFKAVEKGSIKAIRCLLWAGLLHEDENLTIKEVGSWLDTNNLREMTGKISGAVQTSLPEEEESPNEDPQEVQ